MQKKLLAALAAAAIGIGGSASASDLNGGYKDVYVAPVSWAGFYIGADLGGLIDNKESTASFYSQNKYYGGTKALKGFSLNNDGDKDEPIGGVHIGYNFQTGNFVYGIEGDVNFASNIDYLATIRGRIGFAMDTWLVYATGGAAFISFSNDTTVTNWKGTNWSFHDGREETGAVVGGGLEKKITPNISLGVEGLFYSFDKSHDTHLLSANWCKSDFADISKDEEFWTVRARLTYHFPVAGAYVPLK